MQSNQATLVLRIPASLHQQLKQESRANDLSLNKHCRNLLSTRTGDASTKPGPTSLVLASGHSRHTAFLQDLSAQMIATQGDQIEGLVLFGSFARGRPTANSDIDLLIVLNRNVTLDRDVYGHWKPQKLDGREVAPLFVQIPDEGERIGGLWFEVALDGIPFYDKDLHLSRFLSHVRDLIAAGRVQRMLTHGHPYWVYSDKTGRDLSSKEIHEKPRPRKRLSPQGQRQTQSG
jgi:predicted nucleotidyltransferase